MIRRPAVAGSFYPAHPTTLRRTLAQLLSPLTEEKDRIQVRGAVVPHAGYLYSGKTAGKVYRLLHIPPTVVLIGPNHFGVGHTVATFASGSWETPLGPGRMRKMAVLRRTR
jgi:MEMO1 family protein